MVFTVVIFCLMVHWAAGVQRGLGNLTLVVPILLISPRFGVLALRVSTSGMFPCRGGGGSRGRHWTRMGPVWLSPGFDCVVVSGWRGCF